MPYRTARRDRMRAAQARATGAAMERDRIGITVEAHEVRVATLGRMVAQRDERIAQLEATCRNYSDSINQLLDSLRLLGEPAPGVSPAKRGAA